MVNRKKFSEIKLNLIRYYTAMQCIEPIYYIVYCSLIEIKLEGLPFYLHLFKKDPKRQITCTSKYVHNS